MAAVTALALKPLGIKVHAEDGKVKNKGQFADRIVRMSLFSSVCGVPNRTT